MPNTSCLFGPAFSITGDSYFSSTAVNFQVAFDNASDQTLILAYEWYLDNILMTGQNNLQLTGQISCGTHTIGVRILSAEGWSGIKNMQFFTCKVPSSLVISGPDSLYEGSSASYYVLQLYTDGTSRDLTAQYAFTSTTGGSFNGNVFTAATDDTTYTSLEVTIGAVRDGVQDVSKQITIKNTTPIVEVSTQIAGPDAINEGASAAYNVIATYSDGSQQDVTSQYVLSATEGTFAGNILTVPLNNIPDDSRAAIIFAAKNGGIPLSKEITINDASAPIIISDFDFMAVRYHWELGAGTDLDILVGYENNGTPDDKKYVGYGQSSTTLPANTTPPSDAYLWWGTDNTGTAGYEGVLIGIKKFMAAYQESPNIVEVALYAVWYNIPGTGNFEVELITYKGGTMSIDENHQFVNSGGQEVSRNHILVNVLISSQEHLPTTSQKIGTVKYNKTTQSASIEISEAN